MHYKQLGEVLRLLALLLMEDFNLPDDFWKCSTEEKDQSRRLLNCVEDNFLTQLPSKPTREDVSVNSLFVNRKGPVDDVMIRGQLGHSSH